MRRSRIIAQKRAFEIIIRNYGLARLEDPDEMLESVKNTIGSEALEFMVDQIELAIKEYQAGELG